MGKKREAPHAKNDGAVRCERGKHTNNNPKSKKNKKQAAAMAAAHDTRTRFGRRAVSASWAPVQFPVVKALADIFSLLALRLSSVRFFVECWAWGIRSSEEKSLEVVGSWEARRTANLYLLFSLE